MENLNQIISVPVITAIVYGAMQLYKYIVSGKEKYIRLIPIISVLFGVALGIIAFYCINSIMPADNIFTAILIGGASGLAATGTNQIFKQFEKSKKEEDDSDEKNENNQ